jgi:hypothetical protein
MRQETVVIDHGDGDIPAVLLTFGDDAGRDLLRGRCVDRRAVVGASVLGRGAGGESDERRAKQNSPHLCFLSWGRGWDRDFSLAD